MDLTLTFAYGSNLDPAQMRSRCPSARPLAIGTLPRHELVFRGASARWGGAVASVRAVKDGAVRGVLYALRPDDLAALDRFEGHPIYYERRLRSVIDDYGARWPAHVYILPAARAPIGLPGAKYLKVIAEAYGRHGFDVHPLRRAVRKAAR